MNLVSAPDPQARQRIKVAPVRVYGRTRQHYVDTYAALDDGAAQCLCSTDLIRLLGLKGTPQDVIVTTATGTAEPHTSTSLKLELRGYRTPEIFEIDVLALDALTDLSEHIPSQSDVDRHPHMRGLRIPDHLRKKVDLLICVGESALHRPYEIRTADSAQLWATKTGLGWVVHGRDSGNPEPSTSSTVQIDSPQA